MNNKKKIVIIENEISLKMDAWMDGWMDEEEIKCLTHEVELIPILISCVYFESVEIRFDLIWWIWYSSSHLNTIV